MLSENQLQALKLLVQTMSAYDVVCRKCAVKTVIDEDGIWCFCDGATGLVKLQKREKEKKNATG